MLRGDIQVTLTELVSKINAPDKTASDAAFSRWQSIAKPLYSMGLLESIVIRLAGIQGTPVVDISKRATIVMCADNGVVAEGVTQTGQEVTAVVAENMTRQATTLCHMSKLANSEVIPVDIGICRPVCEGVLDRCVIRGGTRNMAKEPAMTREECEKAIITGAELAMELKEKGYNLLATGEMGIGNTTSSSAVASVLLGSPVEEMTGRGAGLSSDGLRRKIHVIEQAIKLHNPDPKDPVDVLSKVGGLDIAGMAGVFLGGAACGIPVLVDGFISGAAALAAMHICKTSSEYMLASHMSREPASSQVLNALELQPLICADMCVGEGTGAVAAMPLLDMGLEVYRSMSTFDDIQIEAYTPQK